MTSGTGSHVPYAFLIVEDSDTLREVLQAVVEDLGHTVTTAANGQSALEALRAGTFDFVLVDLGLPDMNGREVLERARAIGLPSTPCFIMMTGLWSPAEAARAKEAGYAYVLQKPFDDAQLLTILRREKK